jgi:hypothetical protein
VVLRDTLPSGACRSDYDCMNFDLMCDITQTTGANCICDALTGSDTCTKYSGCIRTPCAICSDCLTQMSAFTVTQLYNQDSSSIAGAFRMFCNRTQTWTSAQCAAVSQAIAVNKPSFGKRAGNLCQGMGVCAAPGAPALGPDCRLKVASPATPDRAAITFTPAALDVCAVEGLKTGSDVPGTTRVLALPAGACAYVPRQCAVCLLRSTNVPMAAGSSGVCPVLHHIDRLHNSNNCMCNF